MRHEHAEILIAIAEGKNIEIQQDGVWVYCHPNLFFCNCNKGEKRDYRVAPETVLINGKRIVKPCVCEDDNHDDMTVLTISVSESGGYCLCTKELYYEHGIDAINAFQALVKLFQ